MAPAQDSNQEREPKAFLRDGMDGWREILDDARWAPSPHNTQPWLVRPVSPEAAELYAPRERLLPVEDPEGRFQTAAQGIFLEALDVAAGTLGLTVETEPLFPSLGADADERPLLPACGLAPVRSPPASPRSCSIAAAPRAFPTTDGPSTNRRSPSSPQSPQNSGTRLASQVTRPSSTGSSR
jgi:hypothetical protein